MEKQIQEPRWEVKVSAKLPHTNAEKIWPFFQDFFGWDKWFPGTDTCYGIHGKNGEVGAVHYGSGEFTLPVEGGGGETVAVTNWVKDRLVAIDNAQKCLTYEVVDNNVGFNNYVGNFKVVPAEDGGGCVIEWWCSVDPMTGLTCEEWISKYEAWLTGIVEKMENLCSK